MHEFSLDYLFCVRCHAGLELQTLVDRGQIHEGFLRCTKCGLEFPIICSIPILWDDFASYLSNRPSLGGELFLSAKTDKMKSFIKKTLGAIRKNQNDIAAIERRWSGIYKANKNSGFYSKIRKILDRTKSNLAVEHGCSIGHMTQCLADNNIFAFGIDKSFYAISEAKKAKQKNLDFFVADSLGQPFGKTKFDVVLALNLIEIIEPRPLLKLLAGQVNSNGVIVFSDPYDYENRQRPVKEPIHAVSLRKELVKCGFTISNETRKPSFIPWNLELNDRASLKYLADLVFATKQKRKSKN